MVADQIALPAVGGPGSGVQTAANEANIFIDWNMFCASLQLQLSQPRPRFTRPIHVCAYRRNAATRL